MLGIILCGGQSSRMGSDKGLLKLQANTWAQAAAAKMMSLGIAAKLSVNKEQYPVYAVLFPPTMLIVDDPLLPVKGPLLGVLSCHVQFPAEDLFLLACDMPLMETALLSQLSELYQNSSNDAFIFTNGGEPEPLCGIYTAGALDKIHSLLRSGKLVKQSMKFMLDRLDTKTIAASEEQRSYFQNFNAHSQLNGL